MRLLLLLCVLGQYLMKIHGDVDCTTSIEYLMEKVKSLEVQLHNLKKRDVLSLDSSIEQNVAFSARLSRDVGDLGKSQPIVCDQVLTNIGGSYNNKTGVFHCNEPGTYVFNIHILAMPQKWAQIELVKNGQNYAHVYAFDDNHFATGSNSVILDVEFGDSVWIRVTGLEHHTNGLLLDHQFTTFSGFLLYPK